ncbi:hypothetical protein GMOD_00002145 [Pyrenophora seminiperda CCB06]|uniref:Uncharacterized protein n=1 Tax=Pyrenophora seminiperda CCB06 TaxID=1302712 RepID=A0A3M7LX57_9PLEO|nr:hypothetical protein GMOD_00002145 [Pyrenophora seminiperda CCB06]
MEVLGFRMRCKSLQDSPGMTDCSFMKAKNTRPQDLRKGRTLTHPSTRRHVLETNRVRLEKGTKKRNR